MLLVESITSKEFENFIKQGNKTIIIPVGSVEAHGPHLPLATDLYTIYEIAKLVSQKVNVLVAPPIYYGLCRSTKNIPGTISIKGEVLKALILSILSEFYRWGIKNFFILSGHAGGTHVSYLLDSAETFIEIRPDARLFVADIVKLLSPFLKELNIPPEDSHAGEWETSLLMHLKPDVVKSGGYEAYPSFPKFRVVAEKEKYWNTGIWGNPTKASPEKGKVLVEKLVSFLVEEIKKLEAEN